MRHSPSGRDQPRAASCAARTRSSDDGQGTEVIHELGWTHVDHSQAANAVRLDVWLDVACLFRTRSEAQKACTSGKIAVNGQTAKPHRLLRAGDEIAIGRPFGRQQRVVVRGVADRHVAKTEARTLYEDLTPKPTAEEI